MFLCDIIKDIDIFEVILLRSLISGADVTTAEGFRSDKRHTVCISGHREKSIIPADGVSADFAAECVKAVLYRYIDMAVDMGYTDFISGLAMGTDLWAAGYILRRKAHNKDIRLIGAMPFLHHADFFPPESRKLLSEAEEGCDVLLSVSPYPEIRYSKSAAVSGNGYSHDLYRDRNYFMVDNSSAVISFYNPAEYRSGTAQTIRYANKCGLTVRSFSIDDVYSIIDEAQGVPQEVRRKIAFLPNVFESSAP